MPSVLCMPAGLPDIVAVLFCCVYWKGLATSLCAGQRVCAVLSTSEGARVLPPFVSLITLMHSYILAGKGLIASGLSSPVGVSTTVAAPFPHWPSST